MAGIGHYGVEVNAKPFGQLDAFEVLADGIGGGAVLGNGLHVQGLAGGLHRAHALQGFVTGRRRDGSGAAQRKQGAQGQAEGLHGTHLGAPPRGRSSCCYGVPGAELRTGHAASCLLQRSGRPAIYHSRCPAVQLSPGAAKALEEIAQQLVAAGPIVAVPGLAEQCAELGFRQLQIGGMQDRLQVFVAQLEGHPQFLQDLVVADRQFQRRCRAAFILPRLK